ncbi:penicillin-binding transpeptidase domain-containing protein [Thermomonospora catenispora]|uniref:penicillin-binding transpeptidase domain-containing protein n=1 Tax=Thermomonospora catenispora TaxID=2493090 RepID=UPI00111F5B42|nr:penicillin-binding transpeptidase domain-containing protein [Thermomonospora catenispora]TNY35183.1 hypothetical protein EIO00_19755 [Thermomonospora catenispora]
MRQSALIAAAAATGVLAGAGAWWSLRGDAGPRTAAERYLAAWARDDYTAMRALVDAPPADFVARHARTRTDLGASRWRFALTGLDEPGAGRAVGSYRAEITLEGGRVWTYRAELPLLRRDGRWRVSWSPRVLHPALKEGQRLRTRRRRPERADILSASGESLLGHPSGSVQQLLGRLGTLSAAQARRLGAPYREGDLAGLSGLQHQYERRLAGRPELAVQIVTDAGGAVTAVKTLHTFPAQEGAPLRTTIDLRAQEAAVRALKDVTDPVSLVAVRASTGEVLAVANKPGGYNRALMGRYPPGSTFKIVTAAALVAGGMSPSSPVPCPARATVAGREFRNFGHEDHGTVSLREAFARSCNTAFARLAVERLGAERLRETARTFGFDTPLIGGLPAVRASVGAADDGAALAAAALGQGRVLVSPLTMAAVAAAAADGFWRSPRLVSADDAARALDAEGRRPEPPRRLEPGVAEALRDLMSAVVDEGTAAGAGLPPGTAGKTGTAEHGSGEEPPHSWFVGHRGDVAFAVLVEGGGTGAEAAAPIAARFLTGL